MAGFVELSREISEGMEGINPAYAFRVRPVTTHVPNAAAHPRIR